MKTSLFDYHLPTELIAQTRLDPPDSSRLLVLDRVSGERTHRHFSDIGEYLRAGDLLIVNDTKVFRARLSGVAHSREFEIFLIRPRAGTWVTLARPRKKLAVGSVILLQKILSKTHDRENLIVSSPTLTVVALPEDGTAIMKASVSDSALIDFANVHGEIPVPPYIDKAPEQLEGYQTVFARETGSVAAPTAAFHFTPRLIAELKAKGVQFASVTLHVGLGTFQPVKTDTLEDHPMHAEWVEISAATAEAINEAKKQGRRVIAVGTTTTRALEGAFLSTCQESKGTVPLGLERDCPQRGVKGTDLAFCSYFGDINIFITPGFRFSVIDGLITNFHLPNSTLLALVSAFAGREHIFVAYREAIDMKYRFFSFGDAMFIA